VSWFTEHAKLGPTMQCQYRSYFLLNSSFIYRAISWKKKAMYQHSEVHNQPTNQTTNQLTNQAHNFTVLTYRHIFVLFIRKCCTIHCILLHFVRHVNSFHNGFALRHLAWPATICTTQALAQQNHHTISDVIIFIHAQVATESCNYSLQQFTTTNELQINRKPHEVTSPYSDSSSHV